MDYEKYLALAVCKMHEMLYHGHFEPEKRENFERNFNKIKRALEQAPKKEPKWWQWWGRDAQRPKNNGIGGHG